MTLRIKQWWQRQEHPFLVLHHTPDYMSVSSHESHLYHFAILVNEPHQLAHILQRLMSKRVLIDGASDHQISHAVYLTDPEGNGIDCHRFWEALYLKCVPIVLNSPFIDILNNMGIPMLILNDWYELDINTLDYNKYKFTEFTINDFIQL
jgi:hypothetical protein